MCDFTHARIISSRINTNVLGKEQKYFDSVMIVCGFQNSFDSVIILCGGNQSRLAVSSQFKQVHDLACVIGPVLIRKSFVFAHL